MKKVILSFILALSILSVVTAQKVAFVDSNFILENIPEYSDAKAEIDELSVKWQNEIEGKFAEIEKLYKSFRAEAVLLPDDIKAKREDDIIKKEREAKDLQKKRFGNDGDLFKRRQEIIKPIQEKVFNAIESIANDEKYIMVFDKANSANIMYGNPKYDISEDVLDKLGYTYKSRD